jgi:DNA helicase II / ATP-dependent DNA helicase PcrA
VTRAMNELTLTYPLTIARGGRGPTTFTMPSRFLTEINVSLVEHGEIEIAAGFENPWPSARAGRERP